MTRTCFLFFAVILTTDLFCTASHSITKDLLDSLHNEVITLQSCSGTEVLRAHLSYILYTQENLQNGIILNSTNYDAIDPQNRVIFIIHGWLQDGSIGWIIEMKNKYLKWTPANVIVLDWSYYAKKLNYKAAFCAVPQVGKLTGYMIKNLTTFKQICPKDVQIIGFSLGAQIAGFAGLEFQAKTGKKFGRIIGLDASGPGFLDLPPDQRLDKTDASCVQGIHTSNYQFGYFSSYGTVDFQVNYAPVPGCGAIQPGCPLNPSVPSRNTGDLSRLLPYVFCNHLRAAVYFIESIDSKNFVGTACKSCINFGTGRCKSKSTAVMGEHCPSTAKGVFYLSTNSKAPFAKGKKEKSKRKIKVLCNINQNKTNTLGS